tara:strand:- start:2973 stop:3902 length:930 start_codon:yes stop_codon:yes gene_type:complete
MIAYSLNEIDELKKNINDFELEEEIKSNLKSLSQLLGIDNHISKNRTNKKEKTIINDDGLWKKQEVFKTTSFDKNTGILEEFDKLRGVLNKVSTKNFEGQKEETIKCIDTIMDYETDMSFEEKTEKVIKLFFNVIINNNFFVELYVKILNRVLEKYVHFEGHLSDFLNKYEELLKSIDYCDPDEDYDKYCSINKANEERRSLLSFVIKIVEEDLCSFMELLSIIESLFSKLEMQINDKSFININEEIIEDIGVFIRDGINLINKNVCKYSISKKIQKYATLKTSDFDGFSSRIKFKCLDLVELFVDKKN